VTIPGHATKASVEGYFLITEILPGNFGTDSLANGATSVVLGSAVNRELDREQTTKL
jgi:hypothetical protein